MINGVVSHKTGMGDISFQFIFIVAISSLIESKGSHKEKRGWIKYNACYLSL